MAWTDTLKFFIALFFNKLKGAVKKFSRIQIGDHQTDDTKIARLHI